MLMETSKESPSLHEEFREGFHNCFLLRLVQARTIPDIHSAVVLQDLTVATWPRKDNLPQAASQLKPLLVATQPVRVTCCCSSPAQTRLKPQMK